MVYVKWKLSRHTGGGGGSKIGQKRVTYYLNGPLLTYTIVRLNVVVILWPFSSKLFLFASKSTLFWYQSDKGHGLHFGHACYMCLYAYMCWIDDSWIKLFIFITNDKKNELLIASETVQKTILVLTFFTKIWKYFNDILIG